MLKSSDPYLWRRRIIARSLLLAVVAGFVALGWWPVPWHIYAAFALPSLLLYMLIWRRPYNWLGWVHIMIDLSMLTLLVRYTGGVLSPFDNLAYIWFFGMVLVYMRRAQTSLVPLFSALAFVALAVGVWGRENWLPYLGFQTLGFTLTALLGVTLLRERSRNLVDPLTRVFHRAAGLERIGDKVVHGLPFVLAFIDLRGFKAINDQYGHAVGDEVICAVAQRVAKELRHGDVVLRYGGDEFVVASEAPALRTRLERLFLSPIHTSVGTVEVRADVGEVGWLPEESLESLLGRADQAMYQKKRAAYGSNRAI